MKVNYSISWVLISKPLEKSFPHCFPKKTAVKVRFRITVGVVLNTIFMCRYYCVHRITADKQSSPQLPPRGPPGHGHKSSLTRWRFEPATTATEAENDDDAHMSFQRYALPSGCTVLWAAFCPPCGQAGRNKHHSWDGWLYYPRKKLQLQSVHSVQNKKRGEML